jgi:hypothetical protein
MASGHVPEGPAADGGRSERLPALVARAEPVAAALRDGPIHDLLTAVRSAFADGEAPGHLLAALALRDPEGRDALLALLAESVPGESEWLDDVAFVLWLASEPRAGPVACRLLRAALETGEVGGLGNLPALALAYGGDAAIDVAAAVLGAGPGTPGNQLVEPLLRACRASRDPRLADLVLGRLRDPAREMPETAGVTALAELAGRFGDRLRGPLWAAAEDDTVPLQRRALAVRALLRWVPSRDVAAILDRLDPAAADGTLWLAAAHEVGDRGDLDPATLARLREFVLRLALAPDQPGQRSALYAIEYGALYHVAAVADALAAALPSAAGEWRHALRDAERAARRGARAGD